MRSVDYVVDLSWVSRFLCDEREAKTEKYLFLVYQGEIWQLFL